MTPNEIDRLWSELRKSLTGNGDGSSGKFWDELFGGAGGMFFDGEGNDRTAMVATLVERIDQLTGTVKALSERVTVLERLAVHDEKRLAEEIEKLRR